MKTFLAFLLNQFKLAFK